MFENEVRLSPDRKICELTVRRTALSTDDVEELMAELITARRNMLPAVIEDVPEKGQRIINGLRWWYSGSHRGCVFAILTPGVGWSGVEIDEVNMQKLGALLKKKINSTP